MTGDITRLTRALAGVVAAVAVDTALAGALAGGLTGAPFARPLTHAPPSQYGRAVVAQWLSDVHAARHAVPVALQTKSPHGIVATPERR